MEKGEIKNLSTKFLMYGTGKSKQIETTLFDLINGDNEIKQTKGLAYVLSHYPELILHLIHHPKIKNLLSKIGVNLKQIKQCDFIQIHAEMLSQNNNFRRDITISLFYENIKKLVIVIEAKSIGRKTVVDIEAQLGNYIDSDNFPRDLNTPIIGVSLTKHNYIYKNSKSFLASLTWLDITKILFDVINKSHHDSKYLKVLKEYFNFLTGVSNVMKFYEKEVLSVPASNTYDIIHKYSIHACPESYNYKVPLYITFRKSKGGVMERLYKIEDIVVLNPHSSSIETIIKESKLDCQERLVNYIGTRKSKWKFEKQGRFRFYVLSQSDQIELKHQPRPEAKNSPGHKYYTLSELLSGKKEVSVESKKR